MQADITISGKRKNAMHGIVVDVNPGICGFDCRVCAKQAENRTVEVTITGSGCTMIQEVDKHINEITMQDLFVPLTKSKIFISAEKAGCHLACPIPMAIAKAAEVALELALPKDVLIRIEKS